MNRKERRAIQFGHFSENRINYHPIDRSQGLQLEAEKYWEEYCNTELTNTVKDESIAIAVFGTFFAD